MSAPQGNAGHDVVVYTRWWCGDADGDAAVVLVLSTVNSICSCSDDSVCLGECLSSLSLSLSLV